MAPGTVRICQPTGVSPATGANVGHRTVTGATAWLLRCHVLPRTVPMPSVPSPSQSPTTGRSPTAPYAAVVVTVGWSRELASTQVPSWKVPMPSLPSPSQSPATGVPVPSPKVRSRQTVGVEPSATGPSARSHSDPRTTPRSVIPSPFQSPVTGTSPACPNVAVTTGELARSIWFHSCH